MSLLNLSKRSKLTRVTNATAAGTSDINSSSVDMSGYDAVLFIVHFGAIVSGAVTSIHAETSSDDSTFNDLEGTSVTVADDDDDQIAYIDVVRPRERYLRCVVDRGTQNATVDAITAVQYVVNEAPTTHDSSTVLGGETHISSPEGTA